jgi:hypothetical protein
MYKNEIHHRVAMDLVPSGKICEWCSNPAEKQLTVIGGNRHNKGGAFCCSCGEKFSRGVVNSWAVVEAGMVGMEGRN